MSIAKKIVAVLTALTTATMVAGPVFGLTADELLQQIQQLQQQLNQLMAQYQQLTSQQPTGGVPAVCAGVTFSRDLKLGMSGNDVKCLQALLNQDPATKVADTGAGSPGNETTYFGAKTKAAVIKFQEKYAADVLTPVGLTAGTGFVGAKTRAKLNAMLAGGVPVTPPTGVVPTKAEVSLDPTTPAAASVALNAQDVIFTKIKFTAGSEGYTVSQIVVARGGVSADADITAIKLYDGTTQLGSTQALNTTTHKATFSGLAWEIPANSTKVLTIKGSIAATGIATVGDSIKLGLDSVTATVTPEGTLPIWGNAMTIAGISVGNLDVDVQPTPAATTILSGATDQEIACWKFTAGNTEGFNVHSIKITHVGSATRDDVKNIKLKVSGTQIGSTVESLDSSNAATFDLSASPLVINAGSSKTVCAYADIASGIWTQRTVIFEITQSTDVVAYGANSGGVTTITYGGWNAFTKQTGNTMTIGQGTLTVALDASQNPSSQSYVKGTTNRLFTAVKFSTGSTEGVRVTKLRFTLAAGTGGTCSATDISNVTLWDGTTQIAGPASVISGYVTFGANTVGWDTTGLFDLEASKTKTILVKADIPTGATPGHSCKLSITSADVWADGLSSKYDIPSSSISGSATGNAHTVVASGSLTVSLSANTPAAQTYVKGATGKEFIKVNLTAGSGEDVIVSAITFGCKTGAQSACTSGTIANAKLLKSDGTQYGTTVANPTASVSFSGSLTVKAATTETLTLVADIPTTSGATSTYFYLPYSTISADLTSTGASSGADIVETGSATGNLMTFGQGSLTVSAASSPADQTVIIGSAEVPIVALVFTAGTAEDVRVTSIKLTQSSSGQGSTTDVTAIALYDGTTRLTAKKSLESVAANQNYVSFSASDFLNSQGFDVSKGQQKVITVKGDIPATAVAGHKFALGVSTTNDITFVGLSSNTTPSPTLTVPSGLTGVNYHYSGSANAYETTLASQGVLTVDITADTPVEAIQAVSLAGVGASNVSFLKVYLQATLEDINVKSITIESKGYATSADPADFASVTLWDGDTQLGSAQTLANNASTTFNFSPENYWKIPKGSVKFLTVKANLNGIRDPFSTGAVTGDNPYLCIDSITAEGASSGLSPTGAGVVDKCGNPQTLRLSKPTIALAAPTSGTFGAGTQELIRWTVTADPKGNIGWRKVVFDMTGSVIITTGGSSYTVGSCPTEVKTDGVYMATTTVWGGGQDCLQLIATSSMAVYDADTNAQITTGQLIVDQATATGTARIAFVANDEQQVAAGTTKTYKLVGNILYGGQAGSAIMTKIEARSTGTTTADYATVAGTDATFVWSDRSGGSVGAHSLTTSDWTNDWKVPGLPTSAKTLSK